MVKYNLKIYNGCKCPKALMLVIMIITPDDKLNTHINTNTQKQNQATVKIYSFFMYRFFLLSLVVINTRTTKIMERKVFISFYSIQYTWKEVRDGNSWSHLEAGTEAKTAEEGCLLAYSPWPAHAGFLCSPGPPVNASPLRVAWALPDSSFLMKMPYRLA